MTDLTGSGQLAKYKQSLLKLKAQIRQFSVNEGVMLNTLFTCGGMRQGIHHLYDDIDRPRAERGGDASLQKLEQKGDSAAYDEDFD